MEASLAQVGKLLKNVSRQLKDQAQELMSNDTPLEKQLKEATANTNWGCSTTLLGEIARATHDYNDFFVIMRHVWESLGSKPKYWRKIYKTFSLLEYLLRHGTDRVAEDVRECMFRIRRFTAFHFSEEGHDRGGGIREKAKHILDLLTDAELLREEREKARANRDRFVGMSARGDIVGPGSTTTGFGYTTGAAPALAMSNRFDRPAKPSRGSLKAIEEREQKRIEAERAQARREREGRQRKSRDKRCDDTTQPQRRQQSQPLDDLILSSNERGTSTGDSTASKPKATKKKGESEPKADPLDLFNTDDLWGGGDVTPIQPPQSSLLPPPPPAPSTSIPTQARQLAWRAQNAPPSSATASTMPTELTAGSMPIQFPLPPTAAAPYVFPPPVSEALHPQSNNPIPGGAVGSTQPNNTVENSPLDTNLVQSLMAKNLERLTQLSRP